MINLALFGCGRRTCQLLDALNQDEFYRVHAVYDLREESALNMVRQRGGTVCKSQEELIAFPGVDAFLISLNPFAQAEALRKCIPAGKPIFVEKPVAFTGKETWELTQLAEKYHVPVQVGFMRRYLPDTVALFDYIKNNAPGRLFSVDCEWFHHGEDNLLYLQRHDPNNFRLQMSQVPFHCCHMLDVMVMAGGPVTRVHSELIKTDMLSAYPSPDDLSSHFTFANGGTGRFHYSGVVYYGAMGYRFHYENYSIKMNVNPEKLGLTIHPRPRFMTSRIGTTPEEKATMIPTYNKFCQPVHVSFPQEPPLVTENIMYDFVLMVRDGVPPAADLRAATRVQGLAEAMELSGKLGKTIEMDENGLPILN